MDYRYGSHTVYQIEYHVVWVTKYRYQVLQGDVGQQVRELVRELLSDLVYNHGVRGFSGGLPLLLLGLRWVVGHRNPVFVACSAEPLGHFHGGTNASPGLGGLFAHLEGQAEEGRAGDTVLGPAGAMAHGGEGRLDGVGGA